MTDKYRRKNYDYTKGKHYGCKDDIYYYYDGDLLIKEWESTSYNDNGLYWYDFNSETNLFDLKVNDSYKETLYFYDEEKRLVRKAVTGTEEFCNYFYDKNGNLIKTETEQLVAENKFNSKNQLIHIKLSNGENKYYKYASFIFFTPINYFLF